MPMWFLGAEEQAEQIYNYDLEKGLKTAYILKLLDSHRAQFQDNGGKQRVN